jgi:hypothetical protein
MAKFCGFLALIICIGIYMVSLSGDLTNKLNMYKSGPNPVIRSDKFRYGDLYGMSYLSYFRKSYQAQPPISPPVNTHAKNIDLYAICDSYLWSFTNTKKLFVGVDSLTLAKTNAKQSIEVNLDHSKKNILLLEFSERNLDTVLSDTDYVKNMLVAYKPDVSPKAPVSKLRALINKLEDIKTAIRAYIFNNDVNTNIESNMWDYEIFSPIKEFKANINYRLFNMVDKDVVVASNKKQLFFNATIDTTENTSAFKYISDKKLNFLIANLNRISARALQMGFDKVYLSIIPNPVSILEPGYNGLKYNHLTERIQGSPILNIPYISLVPVFTANKNIVYYKSDTHWNQTGAAIWLNLFNAELAKY